MIEVACVRVKLVSTYPLNVFFWHRSATILTIHLHDFIISNMIINGGPIAAPAKSAVINTEYSHM
jgi:hypothetical protein